MKQKLIATALLGLMIAASTAHAASIDYGNYTVEYDETFWGTSLGTSVSPGANSLSFSNLGYVADIKGGRGGWNTAIYSDYGNPVLSLVVDAGYQLTGFGYTASGRYSNTGAGSSTAYTRADAFDASGDRLGYGMTEVYFNVEAGSYAYESSFVTFDHATQFASFNFNTRGSASANLGSAASITHDGSTFTFSVTAVPEPETYAMFLAGLGLMGAIARRRGSAREA